MRLISSLHVRKLSSYDQRVSSETLRPCISSPFKRLPSKRIENEISRVRDYESWCQPFTTYRVFSLRILRSCECNDKIERTNTEQYIYIYTHTCVSPLRTKSTNNEEGGACTMTADTCTWRKRNHRNVITPFLERTMKYSSVPVLLPCTSLSLRGFCVCVCVWHRETGILNFEDRFCILEEEIGFAFLQFQVKSNHGFVNRGIMGEKSG